MNELVEKRNEFLAKQKKLAKIFEESKVDSGTIDLMKTTLLDGKDAKARQEQVVALNRELDDLGHQVEVLAEVEKAQKRADEYQHPSGEVKAEQRVVKSFGEMFVESEAYKVRGKSAVLDGLTLKALMQTTSGWAPESIRTGRVVEYPSTPIQIVDLIPGTTTGQNAIVYMEEQAPTSGAAEVAEGGVYGESAFSLVQKTSSVVKIGVFVPVTDEQLDDVAQVQGYLNNRLTYQLRARLDNQIVNGNGTPPNLTGILNATGIKSQAKGADTIADAVFKGIMKVINEGKANPNVVLFNPADWQTLRLLKDTQGNYIWGPPSESGPSRIWGYPVVITPVLSAGIALTGDFATFIELAERTGIDVQITNSHADYFTKGIQVIRADVRVALPIYRPSAFCEITGLNV